MLKANDISIRNKLVLMQVFTSVIVLGLCFIIFIITDLRSYKRQKEIDLQGLAQVLATNNVSTLEFQDNEEANRILSDLSFAAPEVTHALITDKNGRVFASYRKPGSGSVDMPPGLGKSNSLYEDNRFYVANDIVSGEVVIGRIFLAAESIELQQVKRDKKEVAAILLLAAIVLSFLIGVIIQTYISKRLLKLVNAMQEVRSTGDYSRQLNDDGRDEISTLIKEFNNLLQEVKQSQQRKDEFIGIASHELKTPLTSVKGYTELLKLIEDREPNKQYVQKALDNVIKLERLIEDLLDVSKIQSGQLELSMNEFDVDQLIDETIASVQLVTGTHSITREDENDHTLISADRRRIEQVLTNLLSNAIKYSPGEKQISVSSFQSGGELVIKIRDYGIGIPKEEQHNIFERFYRAKGTSITISGFGLGLYICRDIIRRHQGKIWVEEEDKGSAFYFSLPLRSNGASTG